MENLLQRVISSVQQLPLSEGGNTTSIPYLSIYRYTQKDIILPETMNPFIMLILSGTMRLHFTSGFKDYSPGHFMISAIDSPLTGQALSVSEDSPFLAITINFFIDDVISVMLDIDGDLPEKLFEAGNITVNYQQQNNLKLLETISRLLNMIGNIDELSFMSKHLKREIIFYMIAGPYGKELLQAMVKIQQAGDIYSSNSWIKQNYKTNFTVDELADQISMSLSSFHHKFKTAVGMGPLQCQKKLRLLESRLLMLDKSLSVTDAALEVGYESVSQFIRDYGRMFGRSPQKDVQVIRESLQTK